MLVRYKHIWYSTEAEFEYLIRKISRWTLKSKRRNKMSILRLTLILQSKRVNRSHLSSRSMILMKKVSIRLRNFSLDPFLSFLKRPLPISYCELVKRSRNLPTPKYQLSQSNRKWQLNRNLLLNLVRTSRSWLGNIDWFRHTSWRVPGSWYFFWWLCAIAAPPFHAEYVCPDARHSNPDWPLVIDRQDVNVKAEPEGNVTLSDSLSGKMLRHKCYF